MRASGERSSWLAFASSERCDCTSASMRPAAWLKLAATAATSSRPDTSTRWPRLPAPKFSTPCCSALSRRVSRRTAGQAPAATAKNSSTSTTTRLTLRRSTVSPQGQSTGPRSSSAPSRGGGGNPRGGGPTGRLPGRITHSVRPSSSRMAMPWAVPSACRRRKLSDAAMRWPFTSSSASGRRRRCDHACSAAACCSTGSSVPGSERWIRSAHAATRSASIEFACTRSSSMCRWNSQPELKANSSSTATTVR